MNQSFDRQPYMRKLLSALAANKLPAGQLTEVVVYHDNHCHLLAGRGPCNCDPDVRLVTAAPSASTPR